MAIIGNNTYHYDLSSSGWFQLEDWRLGPQGIEKVQAFLREQLFAIAKLLQETVRVAGLSSEFAADKYAADFSTELMVPEESGQRRPILINKVNLLPVYVLADFVHKAKAIDPKPVTFGQVSLGFTFPRDLSMLAERDFTAAWDKLLGKLVTSDFPTVKLTSTQADVFKASGFDGLSGQFVPVNFMDNPKFSVTGTFLVRLTLDDVIDGDSI